MWKASSSQNRCCLFEKTKGCGIVVGEKHILHIGFWEAIIWEVAKLVLVAGVLQSISSNRADYSAQ
ncbi:unnamed protein product [Coffea canephora]|uniref:Uncharacterized protein n=1 Tax=Coffea canephora TaxID=49390 RepID=A0A068ULA3_COFCA|nr:unnamed protein product [Coffea canephora]